MKLFSRMRRRWVAYLERMAAANKEQYGPQRLDCCGLNSRKPEHTQGSQIREIE